MSTELDHTSIVILGAWNPAIVAPPWLHQHEIVRKLPQEVQFGFQPLTRAIRFELAGMTWEVSDSRLTIIARGWKNAGRYGAKVLGLLPHTPIQAIGTNFVFKTNAKDWPRVHLPSSRGLRFPGKPRGISLSQVSWQAVADIDKDTVLKLTITKDPDVVVTSFNLHRNCDSAEKARTFARRWRRDRDIVQGILHRQFKVNLA